MFMVTQLSSAIDFLYQSVFIFGQRWGVHSFPPFLLIIFQQGFGQDCFQARSPPRVLKRPDITGFLDL